LFIREFAQLSLFKEREKYVEKAFEFRDVLKEGHELREMKWRSKVGFFGSQKSG